MRLPWRGGTAPALRRIEPGEAALVAELHAESFARPWSEAELEALLLDRAVAACGAFAPGPRARLAGFALTRLAADEGEILTVAVARRERGAGLGRRLMEGHIAALRERGVRLLFLEVEAGNAPALALYRRVGFEVVGRREAYYPMADGGRAHALVMRRPLP